jgi:hypothetical protein
MAAFPDRYYVDRYHVDRYHNVQSQDVKLHTSVVSLSTLQRALWQLRMPILNAGAVADYKKGAKLGMLWSAIRGQFLGIAVLVALECLGRQWSGVGRVAGAAGVLATLVCWLTASELRWRTMPYETFASANQVPLHVSAAADALLCSGIAPAQIGVEYLRNDPILFVTDAEQQFPGSRRYDLIIW